MSVITNNIINYTIQCEYKGYLKRSGEDYHSNEFETLKADLRKNYQREFIKNNCQNPNYTFPETIENQNILLEIDAFYKSESGQIVPLLISPNGKIDRSDKVYLSCILLLLKDLSIPTAEYGRFIFGKNQRTTKVSIKPYIKECKNIIKSISDNQEPQFFLKRHCNICGFYYFCRQKAEKEDSLSLFSGITRKEIQKWQNKGIFTIKQLSYNFRPRRRISSRSSKPLNHKFELRALSIRESSTHIYEMPLLPSAETEIFVDFEGLPDENYIYLIGLIVRTKKEEFSYSYWANSIEEEKLIFNQFIGEVIKHDDYVLYHYGNYEIKNLKRIKKKFKDISRNHIDSIINSSCNLLSYFHSNIYLPIYSNGLKDVGNYLGFSWSNKNSNGIQSIVWRKRWEETTLNSLKSTIVEYNIDDCLVLKEVKAFIISIIENEQESVIKINDLKKESVFERQSAYPEIDTIKKFSYFDYQKEKISARKMNALKKTSTRLQKKKRRTKLSINKCKIYNSRICPSCRKNNILKKYPIFKKTIDLKFNQAGVKKWIIKHCSHQYLCLNCKKNFSPPNYVKIDSLYGFRLKCWIIFQHIVNRESFQQIEFNLWEIFGIKTHKGNIIRYKSFFANYYKRSIERVKKNLMNGEVLYVDETPFNLKAEKGYVWVFTNIHEVLCIYKSSREGSFLKEFLKNFKGVLVTDFYSAYDSLDCPQQKCLIHIIRDFNDDLLINPFDSEFKALAKYFTTLLQDIIKTVDKFGLKKQFLIEHKKDVEEFFSIISKNNYDSDIAKKYQLRLKKNRSKLFRFIEYDNVSWNNSIAEHAIKLLSSHSHKTINSYTSTKIDDYLKLMSLFITCEYNDISFLKFLLSQKKDFYRYCQSG